MEKLVEKSYYETIDDFLIHYKNQIFNPHPDWIAEYVKTSIGLQYKFPMIILNMMHDQLLDDKLIEKIDTGVYRLTYKGLLFIEDGGYTRLQKVSKIDKTTKTIHLYVLSIGTGAAGLYSIFEISKWAYHHFCH